jgi:hypothetical protein
MCNLKQAISFKNYCTSIYAVSIYAASPGFLISHARTLLVLHACELAGQR